jgi:hypothetical protein
VYWFDFRIHDVISLAISRRTKSGKSNKYIRVKTFESTVGPFMKSDNASIAERAFKLCFNVYRYLAIARAPVAIQAADRYHKHTSKVLLGYCTHRINDETKRALRVVMMNHGVMPSAVTRPP